MYFYHFVDNKYNGSSTINSLKTIQNVGKYPLEIMYTIRWEMLKIIKQNLTVKKHGSNLNPLLRKSYTKYYTISCHQ